MKTNIISVGSSIRDMFIPNHKLEHTSGKKINIKQIYFDIGGGGTNTAATFANMSLKTSLLSQIGNDLTGKEILEILKKFKINTHLVNTDQKQKTGYSIIFISPKGDRTALIYRGASQFKNFKLPINKLKADWFFITSVNGNIKLLNKIYNIAQKNKTKIAWNPGIKELAISQFQLKPLLNHTHVLLLNIKETQILTKSKSTNIKILFNKLSKLAPNSILSITAGQKGAWVKTPTEQKIYHADILNKKIINATGAGDAFGSGFISGLILYENNIKKSLKLAMLNSNGVITQMGAKHGLLSKPPTAKMLNKIKIKEL